MNLDNSFVLQNFPLFHEGSSEMYKRGTMLRLTKNITDLEGPDFSQREKPWKDNCSLKGPSETEGSPVDLATKHAICMIF